MASFQRYKPHSARMSEMDEQSPLLITTAISSQSVQSELPFASSVRVMDEAALLEAEEEKMADINESMADMKSMFEDLDAIVSEQGAVVEQLESNVRVSKEHINKGGIELGETEVKRQKARKQKIALLMVLLLVLAVLIAFVWVH